MMGQGGRKPGPDDEDLPLLQGLDLGIGRRGKNDDGGMFSNGRESTDFSVMEDEVDVANVLWTDDGPLQSENKETALKAKKDKQDAIFKQLGASCKGWAACRCCVA